MYECTSVVIRALRLFPEKTTKKSPRPTQESSLLSLLFKKGTRYYFQCLNPADSLN